MTTMITTIASPTLEGITIPICGLVAEAIAPDIRPPRAPAPHVTCCNPSTLARASGGVSLSNNIDVITKNIWANPPISMRNTNVAGNQDDAPSGMPAAKIEYRISDNSRKLMAFAAERGRELFEAAGAAVSGRLCDH